MTSKTHRALALLPLGVAGCVGAEPAKSGACDTPLHRVEGRVVDDAGRPLADAAAQLCLRLDGDRLVCLRPARTDAAGAFALDVPPEVSCPTQAATRVLTPGDPGLATAYCHLPLSPGAPVVRPAAPFVLYRTAPARLPAAGDPAAARWVDFGGGLAAAVAPASLSPGGDDVYPLLGARELAPDDVRACPLHGAPPFAAVFAFAPEADVAGAGSVVQLPARGLPAGTPVDLYVLGGLDCTLASGEVVPEAAWRPFGAAAVGPDGTIRAGGLPCLTWLAYAVASE